MRHCCHKQGEICVVRPWAAPICAADVGAAALALCPSLEASVGPLSPVTLMPVVASHGAVFATQLSLAMQKPALLKTHTQTPHLELHRRAEEIFSWWTLRGVTIDISGATFPPLVQARLKTLWLSDWRKLCKNYNHQDRNTVGCDVNLGCNRGSMSVNAVLWAYIYLLMPSLRGRAYTS